MAARAPTAEMLRHAFHRHLGVSPSNYRERFRSTKGAGVMNYGLLIFDGVQELDGTADGHG